MRPHNRLLDTWVLLEYIGHKLFHFVQEIVVGDIWEDPTIFDTGTMNPNEQCRETVDVKVVLRVVQKHLVPLVVRLPFDPHCNSLDLSVCNNVAALHGSKVLVNIKLDPLFTTKKSIDRNNKA